MPPSESTIAGSAMCQIRSSPAARKFGKSIPYDWVPSTGTEVNFTRPMIAMLAIQNVGTAIKTKASSETQKSGGFPACRAQ